MGRTTGEDRGAKMRLIDSAGLDALIAALGESHEVWGPVKRDAAVVFEPIEGIGDLPRGWVDEQSGGKYRLKQDGAAFFGYTTAPATWKRLLHPPVQPLWKSELTDGEVTVTPEPLPDRPMAFIGVRACDLAAIGVQDKVFVDGPYRDPYYAARREKLFLVAVNCGRAAETCFCTSMGSGPRAKQGFDIALTEIGEGRFTAEAGSAAGEALLARLSGGAAGEEAVAASQRVSAEAEAQIGKHLETKGLRELLHENPEHARWAEVAERCLGCGNCTMVCPTCFCTEMVEESAIDMSVTERSSRWASCFSIDFTHVHGGSVRSDTRSRYRQWMTHKLSTWIDQFDTSGCIGCGRCITWCPVGIDITEEAAAIRADVEAAQGGGHAG